MSEGSDRKTFATVVEARERLDSLTDEEWLSLATAARFRRGLPADKAEELLGEAVGRVLEGRRRWPRHVSFVIFLGQTMRSIASEWLAAARGGEIPASSLGSDDPPQLGKPGEGYLERQPAADEGPDQKVGNIQVVSRIEAQFTDDPAVMAILQGRYDQLSPDEIQLEFGITPYEYRAAQKRLRRAVLAGKLDDLR